MSMAQHNEQSATGTQRPPSNPELVALAAESGAEIRAWSPVDVEQFIEGQITLGELEGIPKEAQYEMARIGYAMLSEGRLDQAGRVFEGLHVLDPFDVYFLTALGSIAQQKGQLEEAEARYTRALEINPYAVPARAHRGEVRVLRGQIEEAVSDFARVAEEDPTGSDPAARRAAAVAQVVLGQLQDQLA